MRIAGALSTETKLEKLASYEPAFLHLNVNSIDTAIDLNKLITDSTRWQEFSVFLHEYVHFLQSVTTTSGVYKAGIYIDLLKSIIYELKASNEPEFDVPYILDNRFNGIANLELEEIYKGDETGARLCRYEYYAIETQPVQNKDGGVSNAKRYKVFYYDLDKKVLRPFYFGSTCLKEYIAFMIQKRFYPATTDEDIPYLLPYKIVEKEYPAFCEDVSNVLALCDASLMALHPAEIFFNTLTRMREQRFLPGSYKEIYDFTLADLRFEGSMGSFDAKSLFEHNVKFTVDQFYDSLKSDIFQSDFDWLLHMLVAGAGIRMENPAFITALSKSEGQMSSFFYELFALLGTPFFTNRNMDGMYVPPRGLKTFPNQPYILLLFREILGVFNGSKKCGMYQFCIKNEKQELTNELCHSAPWLKVNEKNLCPFAQLWQTWGLKGKIPRYKDVSS